MREYGQIVASAVIAVSVLAVATTGLVVSSAAAVEPRRIVHERFDDRFVEDPDAAALELCGVEVVSDFHIWGSFTLFEDLSAISHVNFAVNSVDAETGAVRLYERDGFTVFSEPVLETIDEVAGTLTLVFEETHKGTPLKWLIPGEGVILLGAGQVTFTATMVIDLATGEEISFEQEFSGVRGPHPALDLTRDEAIAAFCGAMQG